MATNELEAKISELKEWEKLKEEAESQAEAIRDEIKAEMLKRETEEMVAGMYIVRWTTFPSSRFDASAFKKEHLDLYNLFTKTSTSRRFTISK